jgi:hypothetical protein
MDGLTHAAIVVYTIGAVGIVYGLLCLKAKKAKEKEEASKKTTNED